MCLGSKTYEAFISMEAWHRSFEDEIAMNSKLRERQRSPLGRTRLKQTEAVFLHAIGHSLLQTTEPSIKPSLQTLQFYGLRTAHVDRYTSRDVYMHARMPADSLQIRREIWRSAYAAAKQRESEVERLASRHAEKCLEARLRLAKEEREMNQFTRVVEEQLSFSPFSS